MRFAPTLLAVATAAVFGGCSATPPDGGGAAAQEGGPLARAVAASATANGVPRDLLVAIAQTEGGLDMPRVRDVAPNAAVPAAGPLQLRHGKLDTLARGAALVGAPELALRRDADLALEAGARVVAELGAASGARAEDLASWTAALQELSGYADAPHRDAYARRVLALLARGGTFDGRDGERVVLPAHEIPPSAWMRVDTGLHLDAAPAEYGPAEWFPTSCTNKCTPGRAGSPVEFIVIHDTEGGWDASVATLQNDPNKSVQYIVGVDGRVGQFIHESDTAWHAGNFYYNERSIGIEHVGYATKPYANAQYDASAKLVAHLTAKYAIAPDRAHIIGHDQVPNGTVIAPDSAACSDAPRACESSNQWGGSNEHRDPGVWEWCTYMARFGGSCKCDDATPTLACSVDGTHAFRCVNGKIELDACAGTCVPGKAGGDATCTVTSRPGGGDAGGGPVVVGPLPPPAPLPDAGASAAPPEGAAPAAPPSSSDDSVRADCRAAPGRTGGGTPVVAFGLLAFAATIARRRRRAP